MKNSSYRFEIVYQNRAYRHSVKCPGENGKTPEIFGYDEVQSMTTM